MNNLNKKLDFVFWGTPEVAKTTLEILKEAGYLPSLVITGEDRPRGRGLLITPPPVKIWAEENHIPYLQPKNIEEINSIFDKINPDLSVVVAYGKILPESILNKPKLGSINIHYSLLPKYRGASPVEAAILNGDSETGITIQKMIYKMDAGPIIAQETIKILQTEKAEELKNRLVTIGGNLLAKILPDVETLTTKGAPQDENLATFCKKIQKEDGLINFSDKATKNYNKFRAYALWPRTFFFEKGKRIIITDASLENNQFVIKKVLPEGKKEISYEDFLQN